VVAGIRPEDLSLVKPDGSLLDAGAATFEAQVELVEALGSEMLVHFTSDARPVEVGGTKDEEDAEGLGEGTLGRAGGVARVESRTRLSAGSRARFELDPERLHFFDAATGEAIAS
jgi:multiple sugar transport system ATP-binding protein